MPRQRLLLIGSWAVTTMFATLVSAAGVSIVTRDVTDDHNPALRQTDVIALLGAPLTPVPGSASTADPLPTTSSSIAPVPTSPPQTSVSVAPSLPPVTEPPPASPPPTPTAPPLDGAVAATFTAPGGTMTVACFDDAIALFSARPNDGFQLVVREEGPERVRVRFQRDGGEHHDDLDAACSRRGAPVLVDDEDPRSGRDRDNDDDRDHDDDTRSGDGDRGGSGSGSGSRSGDDDDSSSGGGRRGGR